MTLRTNLRRTFQNRISKLFITRSFIRVFRAISEVRERRKGEIEKPGAWNGSSGMVQGYPQSTLLAAAASRAKDKGRPTLSSVPTLRHLPYMPFRNTIRSACGSNGSHVSCVHVYPSHNEHLPFPIPPSRALLFLLFRRTAMHFGPEFRSNGLSKRQRARASRRYVLDGP